MSSKKGTPKDKKKKKERSKNDSDSSKLFLLLPQDILLHLLAELSAADICSLMRVSKSVHQMLINDDKMWKNFYSNFFGPPTVPKPAQRSYDYDVTPPAAPAAPSEFKEPDSWRQFFLKEFHRYSKVKARTPKQLKLFASVGGHVKLLKKLLDQDEEKACEDRYLKVAIDKGYLELVEYILPLLRSCSESLMSEMLRITATNNYVAIAKLLVDKFITMNEIPLKVIQTQQKQKKQYLKTHPNAYKPKKKKKTEKKEKKQKGSKKKEEPTEEKEEKSEETKEKTKSEEKTESKDTESEQKEDKTGLPVLADAVKEKKKKLKKFLASEMETSIYNGHKDMLEYLLSIYDAHFITVMTPLAMACQNGKSEIVHYLLKEKEPDIVQTQFKEQNSWYRGQNIDRYDIVCSCLANWRVEERMKLYKVMLEYGEQKGGKEVKQEMLNVGLLYCCTRGLTKDDPWNFILQSGADINGKNAVGDTPLHLLAQQASVAPAEELIKKGAKVNAKNNVGSTPLHCVVANGFSGRWDDGSVKVAKILIANGADLTITNDKGNTPLQEVEAKMTSQPNVTGNAKDHANELISLLKKTLKSQQKK